MPENKEKKIEPVVLKEYLGTIVNSISGARMNADIQSVAIAKMYSDDQYMKHLSIPRMKIKDVQLDIPVAIDSFSSESSKSIDNQSFMSEVYSDIKDYLMVDSIPEDLSYHIRKEIFYNIDKLEKNIVKNDGKNLSKYIGEFSKIISDNIVKTINDSNEKDKLLFHVKNKIIERKVKTLDIKGIGKNLDIKIDKKSINKKKKSKSNSIVKSVRLNDIKKDLKDFIIERATKKLSFIRRDNKIDQMKVIAHPHVLKELPPESLVRIKAVVSEESLEWSFEDNGEDGVVRKLLPE